MDEKKIIAVIGPYSSFNLLRQEFKNPGRDRDKIEFSAVILQFFDNGAVLSRFELMDVMILHGADVVLAQLAWTRVRS